MGLEALYVSGQYAQAVVHADARPVLAAFVQAKLQADSSSEEQTVVADRDVYVGLAALNAFLQANVTGPVLDPGRTVEQTWTALEGDKPDGPALRIVCLASLDVDGVSVYPYMQHVELFCLARWVFTERLLQATTATTATTMSTVAGNDPAFQSLQWTRLRIHTWHYKLLAEPNPGPGSVFNKVTQWSELPSLQERIQQCLEATEKEVLGADSVWSREAQVQFLVEKNNVYAMIGLDAKAQEALDAATRRSRFAYVLSGALGKRTRFQDKSTSQLVILARSEEKNDENDENDKNDEKTVPQALPLNNDTLLENIDFGEATPTNDSHGIPPSLEDISPDKQPALAPLDQIILLAVATLKDAFSPVDALTLEEILPYATRVLLDKATNWQIYSQALLVRSRIEMHRSRTVERGVLQMQAIVDQVVVDTGREGEKEDKGDKEETETVPTIAIHDSNTATATATTFLPSASPSEQAPPQDRLRYIHALSTPPLWHLESELAFAWAGVGSLVSALAIFQRLRLWAEVALCLASSGSRATADEDGRGAGGEEKARALLRWQLFEGAGGQDRDSMPDIDSLRADDYCGPERSPSPANAPRLLCILGDIEAAPQHYERAWELSRHRYARAQRSLGEHYLRQRDWTQARDAYQLAVGANRLDTQLWNRLGDIQLRLGAFDRAAEAFSRAIGSANDVVGGEDARTWSNLGSALYSMYTEAMGREEGEEEEEGEKGEKEKEEKEDDEDDEDGEGKSKKNASSPSQPPHILLAQALAAYKRGAALAHDNWRIWDNVVTLASRARPPAVADMVVALRNIVRIRASETAIDVDVFRLLFQETVLTTPTPSATAPLARGTVAKAVCDLIEDVVVPLITTRSELWALAARERAWRGDRAGALDAAEKGWRAAMGGALAGSGRATLGVTTTTTTTTTTASNWLEDAEAWDGVVARTDELVTMLENYGPDVATVGSRWKGKARSALRSVMSKGREAWEGSPGWTTLEGLLGELQ